MRTLLATLTAVSLVALGAAAASAAPAKTTKLTPTEAKWATPVVTLWNTLNTSLLHVSAQAAANEALLVGTKTNLALNKTLANFITCSSKLKKPGAAPPRLTTFASTMKRACTRLAEGGHDFALAIGAIYKGNSTLAQKLLIQGVGQFKQGSAQLGQARKQLLALGGKNIFG